MYCRIGVHARVLCLTFSRIFLQLQETKSIRIPEQMRVIEHSAVESPSEKDLRAGRASKVFLDAWPAGKS